MQTASQAANQWLNRPPNSTPPSSPPLPNTAPASPPRKATEGYTCFVCKDMGWFYRDLEPSHPDFGKAVRCTCQIGQDSERRRRYLLRIDGLTPAERTLTFAGLIRTFNAPAIEAVEQAVKVRRGLLTLVGKPGTGKSALLMCAVNDARERNVPAVYTTVTDLLDYLRAAYNPANAELAFDARWDLLVRCEVLALDELDEFNATPWANERFLRLMDERWRNLDSRLTLCATNANLNAMPEKVASRLRDGRGRVLTMATTDMRPYQREAA